MTTENNLKRELIKSEEVLDSLIQSGFIPPHTVKCEILIEEGSYVEIIAKFYASRDKK